MNLIYCTSEFGPKGPIPNSIGMTHQEFLSHYNSIPMQKGSHFFYFPEVHQYFDMTPMFIHTSELKNNYETYKSLGPIIYIINIHHDLNYFISLFYGTGKLSWIEFIPEQVLRLWERGRCHIVLSHNWARCPSHLVNSIFTNFFNTFKTINNFYIWSTTVYLSKIVEDTIDEKFKKNLIYFPYAELWSNKNLPNYEKQDLVKNKKYIKLCRRYTHDRLLSHITFTKENLNEYGFISMPHDCPLTNKPLKDYIQENYKHEDWSKIDDINLQGFTLDQPPINTKASYIKNWMGFAEKENLVDYYYKSYFSVVSESRFAEYNDLHNGFFYTEKIIRAIMYEHPFILQALPFALEHLKTLGYNTFFDHWNEDYDTIIDPNKRIFEITKVVKDLCTNKNLDEVIYNCQNIINHNKKNMLGIIENFKKHIIGLQNVS